MSNWKVSKEKLELFPHFNAERLQVGRVGDYQIVVQAGLYNDGDDVVFAPEKSILTGDIRENFVQYLSGSNKDRIKAVNLRGEPSSGILIPKHLLPKDISEYEYGVDISEELGISKYEPPIPQQLAGQVNVLQAQGIKRHDCEHLGAYINEFIQGERIILTEKIHGSQANYFMNKEGVKIVSSKGLLGKGLEIKEDEGNSYWRASKRQGLFELMNEYIKIYSLDTLQIIGEVCPIQKGYSYGFTDATVRLFDVMENGKILDIDTIRLKFPRFYEIWSPILFDGVFNEENLALIRNLKEGMETVSGKSLHIKEGAVLRPFIDRKDKRGNVWLKLKILNSKYKETGEETN